MNECCKSAVLEQVQIVNGKCIWAEDHYFNLTSSMRIARMEIPNSLTPSFFEEAVLKAKRTDHEVIDFWVYVQEAISPSDEVVKFCIQPADEITHWSDPKAERLGLYHDFYAPQSIFNLLHTGRTLLDRAAGVFARENDFDNVVMLNSAKHMASVVLANVFLVFEGRVVTPRIEDGALKNVIRTKTLKAIDTVGYTVEEAGISPFEMQRCEEIFWVNTLGLHYAETYRKNSMKCAVSKRVNEALQDLFFND